MGIYKGLGFKIEGFRIPLRGSFKESGSGIRMQSLGFRL